MRISRNQIFGYGESMDGNQETLSAQRNAKSQVSPNNVSRK